MSSKLGTLEKSLEVPSVKELATQLGETVPSRYIRDDVSETDYFYFNNNNVTNPMHCVPEIDMAKLVTHGEGQNMELIKLHNACKDWGIFHLINHGISKDLISAMKQKTKEFFNLPLKEKQRYAKIDGGFEGFGQHFVLSEDQKLEWSDNCFLRTFPIQDRNFRFWPDQDPPNYRETIETYSEQTKTVAVSLAGFIAKGLGLEAETFSKAYEMGLFELKLNCYPKCPQPEKVLGANSHTDINGITLLLDCGDVAALQVLKDGQWVFVEPKTDAFIVNVADMFEVTSNGIYKAPYHRALVNKSKERISIATFCYPGPFMDVGPAQQLIREGFPPLYKTLTFKEYVQVFFDWNFAAVPFIDLMKL